MFVRSNRLRGVYATALLLTLGLNTAEAAEKKDSPAVVELFTSQGCYSCPPAEAYLGQLSKRQHVVALEYHVDYWDDLVYGNAGKWKDPFSSPLHTQRQRQYNLSIRKKTGVYTPQMVIGGILETVGSHENKVEKAIEIVGQTGTSSLSVKFSGSAPGILDIQVGGSEKSAAGIWVVYFHPSVETRVRSGENKGKTLTSHNIVTQVVQVGEWRGAPLSLTVTRPKDRMGDGCAVIVQSKRPGPILGASYCPGYAS